MELIFTPLNLNPKGKITNDCVIRCIAKALEQSWKKTYIEMATLSMEKGLMLNDKRFYEKYLTQKLFKKYKQPKKENKKKYTIREFIEEQGHLYNNKTIIFSVRKHLTVVRIEEKEAVLYDTWDCSNQYVGNYYIRDNKLSLFIFDTCNMIITIL